MSEKNKFNETTINQTGLSLGVGFSAARDVFHRLNYELSQSKTTVSSTTATSITGEAGETRLRSSLNYVLSKDTRDNRFDPTEGYLLKMDETLAGFGGDVKFLRTKLSAAYYKPLLFKSVIIVLTSLPNSDAKSLRTFCRVPEIINLAPHFFIFFTIDIPMPPDAPVIRTTLSDNSNI